MFNSGTMGFMLIFQLINLALILGVFTCATYAFILFVKLAKRGIKALDIYIGQHSSKDGI